MTNTHASCAEALRQKIADTYEQIANLRDLAPSGYQDKINVLYALITEYEDGLVKTAPPTPDAHYTPIRADELKVGDYIKYHAEWHEILDVKCKTGLVSVTIDNRPRPLVFLPDVQVSTVIAHPVPPPAWHDATALDTNAIRARLAKITPGQWMLDGRIPNYSAPEIISSTIMRNRRVAKFLLEVGSEGITEARANAEFIAHAPGDVLALLNALTAANARAEALERERDEDIESTDILVNRIIELERMLIPQPKQNDAAAQPSAARSDGIRVTVTDSDGKQDSITVPPVYAANPLPGKSWHRFISWRWFNDGSTPVLVHGTDDYNEAQRALLESPMDDKSYYVIFDVTQQKDVFTTKPAPAPTVATKTTRPRLTKAQRAVLQRAAERGYISVNDPFMRIGRGSNFSRTLDSLVKKGLLAWGDIRTMDITDLGRAALAADTRTDGA